MQTTTIDPTTVAKALAAVAKADADIEAANEEARRIQREAGDARARAVAHLVDLIGRIEAARLLDVAANKVDRAVARARGIRRAR